MLFHERRNYTGRADTRVCRWFRSHPESCCGARRSPRTSERRSMGWQTHACARFKASEETLTTIRAWSIGPALGSELLECGRQSCWRVHCRMPRHSQAPTGDGRLYPIAGNIGTLPLQDPTRQALTRQTNRSRKSRKRTTRRANMGWEFLAPGDQNVGCQPSNSTICTATM